MTDFGPDQSRGWYRSLQSSHFGQICCYLAVFCPCVTVAVIKVQSVLVDSGMLNLVSNGKGVSRCTSHPKLNILSKLWYFIYNVRSTFSYRLVFSMQWPAILHMWCTLLQTAVYITVCTCTSVKFLVIECGHKLCAGVRQ